jgi:hypothetical protein
LKYIASVNHMENDDFNLIPAEDDFMVKKYTAADLFR